jgi:hypothetical protein
MIAIAAVPGRIVRMVAINDGDFAGALPKTEAQRNRALLHLARDAPCLLRVPGVCNDDRQTTVAAHSNLQVHGKAGARKADDQYSVWACARCHTWLDSSYNATLEQKAQAFEEAHARQRGVWHKIANDPERPARDRNAAQWALDRIQRGENDG